MAQILTHTNSIVNSPSSVSSNYLIIPKKLHSADIAFLKILAWFRSINKHCYLTPDQWIEWLIKFGGKKISYRQLKSRYAKLRALGFISMDYQNGNRNLSMIKKITDLGLIALEEWKEKNFPSKEKKRPLKTQKTSPPLKIRIRSYENHENDVSRFPKKPPIQHPVIEQLKDFGLYEGFAQKLFREKGENQIKYAIDLTKKRKVNKPGAYISRILQNPIFDNRKYNLEEKAEAEKQKETLEGYGKFSDYMHKIKEQLGFNYE